MRTRRKKQSAFYTDGKGHPLDDAQSNEWYHGSPEKLSMLLAGSAITRNRRLAEAFSHKPTIMSVSNNGHIRHDGRKPGYLYVVDEPVGDDDAEVHPGIVQSDPWELTTKRDLKLNLVGSTIITRDEKLSKIRAMLMRAGTRIAVVLRRRTKRS